MRLLIPVMLSGAVGAGLRYSVVVFTRATFPSMTYLGTGFVNVFGSFLMGLMAALVLRQGGSSHGTVLIMTGVLGGFTTFSAFSLELVSFFQKGEVVLALAYALSSVVFSFIACFLGFWLLR